MSDIEAIERMRAAIDDAPTAEDKEAIQLLVDCFDRQQATITTLRAERDALIARADKAEAALAKVREAARRSAEGWDNAIELGIIPPRNCMSASILRDELRASLTEGE